MQRTSPVRPWLIEVAAVGCTLVIAGCGASGSAVPGTGTSASSAAPLQLSQCMHAHGVPNFPDPTAGPGGEGLHLQATPGGSSLTVDGTSFSGPAFQSAQKACAKFLPGGNGSAPQVSASQKRQALAFARCMRTRGVPDFPDPMFPAGGGIELGAPPPGPDAPAFRQASKACGVVTVRAGP